jgi:PAS domain S-box-containing protein
MEDFRMVKKPTYEELEQRVKKLERADFELMQAEESLRESEEKYRSLTNNLNVGVYRNTIGPKGKFIEANPAIVEMFGYDSREEYLEVSVSDLYMNPEDRKKYNAKILRDGFVKNEELHLRKKDGTSFIGSVFAVAVKDEKGDTKRFCSNITF